MFFIYPECYDWAALILLVTFQLGAPWELWSQPTLSPANPIDYNKSTDNKCKKQRASGKGRITSWKWRPRLGVRPSYRERITV